MTIKTRMTKVNKVAQAALLIHTSNYTYNHELGKLVIAPRRSYHVNSVRDDKPYQVFIELTKEDNILTINAKLYSFEAKYHLWQHPANVCGVVCYQVLGAIKAAAKAEGKAVSFCETFEDMVKLLNFGGVPLKIRNMGRGTVWGVVR